MQKLMPRYLCTDKVAIYEIDSKKIAREINVFYLYSLHLFALFPLFAKKHKSPWYSPVCPKAYKKLLDQKQLHDGRYQVIRDVYWLC